MLRKIMFGLVHSLAVITLGAAFLSSPTLAASQAHNEPGQSSAPAPTAPDSRTTDFQLLARAMQPKVQVGAQVVVQVSVRNISKELRWFNDFHLVLEEFDMEVRNGAGKLMPLTRYGQMNLASHTAKHTGEIALSVITWKLKPGEEKSFPLLVNRIYDMSVSDEYFITIKRHFVSKDLKKAVEVSSNPVKVDVSYFDFTPPLNPIAVPPAEGEGQN